MWGEHISADVDDSWWQWVRKMWIIKTSNLKFPICRCNFMNNINAQTEVASVNWKYYKWHMPFIAWCQLVLIIFWNHVWIASFTSHGLEQARSQDMLVHTTSFRNYLITADNHIQCHTGHFHLSNRKSTPNWCHWPSCQADWHDFNQPFTMGLAIDTTLGSKPSISQGVNQVV